MSGSASRPERVGPASPSSPTDTGIAVRQQGPGTLAGVDLAGAHLVGADLGGVDLSHANLTGAVLDQANLAGARLRGANLTRASMRGVRASGADFEGATLSETVFVQAQLQGAVLTPGHGCDFRDADLSGANLTGSSGKDMRFLGANLASADLGGCQLARPDFRGAQLSGTNVTRARLSHAVFDRHLVVVGLAGLQWATLHEPVVDDETLAVLAGHLIRLAVGDGCCLQEHRSVPERIVALKQPLACDVGALAGLTSLLGLAVIGEGRGARTLALSRWLVPEDLIP